MPDRNGHRLRPRAPGAEDPPGRPDDHYRRQLEAVANNATLALFIMNERQQCTYMNPAAEALTGFRLEEVQGKPLHDYVHHTRPDGTAYPLAECPIDQAFPQNLREQGEEVFVHKDGHFYPVAFTASPILEDGRPVGTILEVRDISHEKRAEAERERLLRELEVERGRLRTVFQQAPAFIAVVRGPEHVFEMANPPYYQLVGHREIMGRPVREALPEVVEQGFLDLLDQVYRSGQPYVGTEVPVRLQREPGAELEERFVNFVYQPLAEADGSIGGILTHGVDVTEQVRARGVVEASAERNRFLAEATEVLVSSLDTRTVLARFADIAVPVLGDFCFFDVVTESGEIQRIAWTHVDPVQQEMFDAVFHMVPPQDFEGHPVARALRTGEPIFVPEVTDAWMAAAATSEQHLRFMRALAVRSLVTVPLIIGEARLGALTFCHAGSGRRHSEEDLRLAAELGHRASVALQHARVFDAAQRARAEAEEANRAKSDFLATMSHELRTPLNAIAGYVDLLDLGVHGPLTAAQRQALERISSNQRHLLALIHDILSYAKLEAGRVELEVARLSVREVVGSLDPLVAPQAAARRVTYQVAETGADVRILGDPERVRQILLNLVGNAIKFTPEGGWVAVGWDAGGDRVRIRVRDSGPGIPAEKQAVIFDPFVQVERRLDRPQEGVGLGLAISRELARAMAGELVVESEPGQGSTFTLELPLASEAGDEEP